MFFAAVNKKLEGFILRFDFYRVIGFACLNLLYFRKFEKLMRFFIVSQSVEGVDVCPIRKKGTCQILFVDVLLGVKRFRTKKEIVVGIDAHCK